MTALIGRYRDRRFACFVISLLAAAIFSCAPASADGGGGGDTINLIPDEARLIKLPERVSTVVVGNPLIADVTIQSGGVVVVSGRGYGVTNLIALDRSGATLMEKQVLVRGAVANTIVVYRGVQRETYSCAPLCNPRITVGDSDKFFDTQLTQTGSWLGQVQGAAQIGGKEQDDRQRSRERDRDIVREYSRQQDLRR